MGVYIKGMKMPPVGRVLMVFPSGRVLEVSSDKIQDVYGDAEAVELPPHGDLIDYNFFLKNYELLYNDDGNLVYAVRMRDISAAPVIIEAEVSE